MPGRVEGGSHVLCSADRGPLEAAGLPARAEVLRSRMGRGIQVDVCVASNHQGVPPAEAARRSVHLDVILESPSPRPGGAPHCEA